MTTALRLPDERSNPRAGLLKVITKPVSIPLLYVLRALHRLSPKVLPVVQLTLQHALSLVKLATYGRPRTVVLTAPGVTFRLSLPGEVAPQQEYVTLASAGETYEPVNTALLTKLLEHLPTASFLDIGAYMGYFACYVAALMGRRGDVCAVESNPIFCDAIRQSARLNGFSRMKIYNVALSSREEPVEIAGPTVLSASGHRTIGKRVLHAMPLDALCEREGIWPNIVKMDVHGAEGKVLLGMQTVLRKSIQFLLLELHPLDFLTQFSERVSRAELLEFLDVCGFATFYVAGHRYQHADGLASFLDTRRFSYVPLAPQTRDLLLFDRRSDILILASKVPDISSLIGPPIPDPSLTS